MFQDNPPETRPWETATQAERAAQDRGRPAITPEEARAFAYQANLNPDDFDTDDILSDHYAPQQQGGQEQPPSHRPPDPILQPTGAPGDDPDIGGEFTTSGTDISDWIRKRAADRNEQEYLI